MDSLTGVASSDIRSRVHTGLITCFFLKIVIL